MVEIKKQFTKVTGWGLNLKADVEVFEPESLEELKKFIKESSPNSILARGLGRSYGDAAQLNGGSVISLKNFKNIKLDAETGTLKVSAGLSIKEIISYIVPKGFFLPVVPGTSNVTIGGSIAADVHGKNHHKDGSFGNHVLKISMIDGNGSNLELSPQNEEERYKFWATVGGMGLTGVIYEATIKLLPITSSLISVDTLRFNAIEELMDEMEKNDDNYKYSVAWIDSLNKRFRGVLTRGNHTNYEELNKFDKLDPLSLKKIKNRSVPKLFPNGILNKFTVSTFNTAWFYKYSKEKYDELQTIKSFFHPLDAFQNWNQIYGDLGFIQYQFFVPKDSKKIVINTLRILRNNGVPTFLTVLKRFGRCNSAYLSFPEEGWTLATDIPNSFKNLENVLQDLDLEILKSGGKIYLAKDSRQSPNFFKKTYKKYSEWIVIKKLLDPDNKFDSDISKRLELLK